MSTAALGTGAPTTCIACGTAPVTDLTLRNGAPLLRCPDCGLGWWPWPAFDPADFYDQSYFQSDEAAKGYNDYRSLEAGVRRTARARLRRIARLAASPGRLFEIGCGTGVFLDEARAAGWQVAGIEVSAYAAAAARDRGLAVQAVGIEALAPPAASAYDCVVLWDVVEHLRDPAGALRAAVRLLKPGGVLALSTGDLGSWCARLSGVRWHLFNLPEHLYFFTRPALARLVDAAGAQVRVMVSEVNWVPLAYLAERLAKSLRGAAPARPDRPRAAWSRWVVPATLFDVVGVYAVRRPDRAAAGRSGLA
jgi:SAM-dependent methyltransferase